MLASHNWLQELTGLELDPADVAKRMTEAGLEVEAVHVHGDGLSEVVVAEVLSARPHPERDRLQLVTVSDGGDPQEIVCGASNVPEPGGRVLLAGLGAKLPNGLEISERKLGGIVSCGMLCGETELDIGSDDSGLLVLGGDVHAPPGTPAVEALGLRDHVYEIGLTPNRPDCLGHVGLARELGVYYGKRFSLPPVPAVGRLIYPDAFLFPQSDATFSLSNLWEVKQSAEVFRSAGFEPLRIDVEAPERCPRYAAALVANVLVERSPFALRYRLHVLGLRSINNVVDATNLIMLGFGHPIHAFDYDKLQGSRIVVRQARDGEQMTTLDGESRQLSSDDLLICDDARPVALAGVMGGADSEISDDTRRVLIECAYFDPRSVRRTAKRLGMHTDSSHRFERGVDPSAVPTVVAHASSMIAELSGGALVESALDIHPLPHQAPVIGLRPKRVRKLLGMEVAEPDMRRLLEGLGCKVAPTAVGLDVTVPAHRPDLTREVDLIEEIARLQGYDVIPTRLPTVHPSSDRAAPDVPFVRRLREAAASAGLDEALNFAFVAPEDLRAAGVSTNAVQMVNPMSEERSVLRTSLLPGLAANLRLAQRHQVRRMAQFEVARTFAPGPRVLPEEGYRLGIMLWGEREHWYREGEPFDFYDLKGVLSTMVGSLSGRLPSTHLSFGGLTPAANLHPKRSAVLALGGTPVGELGELHPDVIGRLDLQQGSRPLFANVDVAALQAAIEALPPLSGRPLPRFPSSVRDLSVVVEDDVEVGDVSRVILKAAGALGEAARLFDVYRGEPVPAGRKSLAFHVVYRDPDATLTDKIVDRAHAKVVSATEGHFAASIRK